MKARTRWALLALPALLAACAKGDDTADAGAMADGGDSTAVQTGVATPPVTDTTSTDMVMATLAPLNNSGVQGTVNFNADPANAGRLVAVLSVAGGTEGGVHQAHVHTGTCDAPGDVVLALSPVTIVAGGGGQSEAPVDVPTATLANGQHIVAVHEANGNPGAPIACGPIENHGASM